MVQDSCQVWSLQQVLCHSAAARAPLGKQDLTRGPHPQLQQRECSHNSSSMQEPVRFGTAEINQLHNYESLCQRTFSLLRSISSKPHTTPLTLTPGIFPHKSTVATRGQVFYITPLLKSGILNHFTVSSFCTCKPSEDLHTCAPPALPHVHIASEACHLPNILKHSRQYVIAAAL